MLCSAWSGLHWLCHETRSSPKSQPQMAAMPFSLLICPIHAMQKQHRDLGAGRRSREGEMCTHRSESVGLFTPRINPLRIRPPAPCVATAARAQLSALFPLGAWLAPVASPSRRASGYVWTPPCNVTLRNVWDRYICWARHQPPGASHARGKRGSAQDLKQAGGGGDASWGTGIGLGTQVS